MGKLKAEKPFFFAFKIYTDDSRQKEHSKSGVKLRREKKGIYFGSYVKIYNRRENYILKEGRWFY
ncbi:hypothetical protein [Planococcus halotolerans]|uniref:Uncharacterized protein n=1 Tax=Planococcus halotolerans TaxID=2233542 RepID=A0A365L1Q4_9BACL|nr:hypothetical protein [Planococcus halotolerans]RAZ78999.1 hypothetical protein DP120_05125 [Planococcus halotolerans]